MTNQQKFDRLRKLLDEADVYARAVGKLEFDMQCSAPMDGMEQAKNDMAVLSDRYFRLTHTKRYAQLVTELHADSDGLTQVQKKVIEHLYEAWEKEKNIPAKLNYEMSLAYNRAYSKWLEAKQAADFSMFSGALAEIISYTHKALDLRENKKPTYYDALLDDSEKGGSIAQLDAFIDALRVTFLGVFGNIATLGAGTLPMQSFYLYRRGLDAGSGLGIMASEYVLHKISVLIYATVALLLGGDWLEQSASGLASYLLIGYVIGALIVIALTLLYTWDKVLKLVLMLLGKLPHMPKWDERREKWANSLTELNREAKKVLLVPSIRVKGIAVSLVKLFVLYSIPYAALRLVGCTALNFAQAQLLASLMLLITSALPNVAGVGPMEFAFLLLFAPWADTAIASSALVLYRVATYFFPFLLSVIVFLREEKKSLKGFDAQSA